MSNTTNTVRLHRVLRASPEPGGHRMSFTNFGTGKSHSFGGTYRELTPHSRIRYTDKFEDQAMPDEMQVTISIAAAACGTELTIAQEGLLAQLVEQDIPDGA